MEVSNQNDTTAVVPFGVCSIGMFLNSECHRGTVTKEKRMYSFNVFHHDEQYAIALRTGLPADSISNVCSFHKCEYLDYYHVDQRTCCDPFSRHTKRIRAQLRPISIQMSQETTTAALIPGKKLCANCQTAITRRSSTPEPLSSPSSMRDGSIYEQSDDSSGEIDIDAAHSILSSIRGKIALSESYEERVSLLTLAPPHWSRRMVCEQFGVTDYMVRDSRKLREEKGILVVKF